VEKSYCTFLRSNTTVCRSVNSSSRPRPQPVSVPAAPPKGWNVSQKSVESLTTTVPDLTRSAYQNALERLEGKTAVPDLTRALKDRDAAVRTRAAVLLGKMGPAARAAVPGLIEAIKDRSDLVRVEAVEALGKIGQEARAAVPPLTETLKDKAYSVRQAAMVAIRKIQS